MKKIGLLILIPVVVLLAGCSTSEGAQNSKNSSDDVCCMTSAGENEQTYRWTSADGCKMPQHGSIGYFLKVVEDSECE